MTKSIFQYSANIIVLEFSRPSRGASIPCLDIGRQHPEGVLGQAGRPRDRGPQLANMACPLPELLCREVSRWPPCGGGGAGTAVSMGVVAIEQIHAVFMAAEGWAVTVRGLGASSSSRGGLGECICVREPLRGGLLGCNPPAWPLHLPPRGAAAVEHVLAHLPRAVKQNGPFFFQSTSGR